MADMCWRANIAGVQRNRARPPRPGTPQRASRAHRLQWLPGFGIGGKAAEFTEACAAYPRFGCGCSSGVEHNLAKVGVVGSNPIARSKDQRISACYRFGDPKASACAPAEAGRKQMFENLDVIGAPVRVDAFGPAHE